MTRVLVDKGDGKETSHRCHLYLGPVDAPLEEPVALCGFDPDAEYDLPPETHVVRKQGRRAGDESLEEWVERRNGSVCTDCLLAAHDDLGWPDPFAVKHRPERHPL